MTVSEEQSWVEINVANPPEAAFLDGTDTTCQLSVVYVEVTCVHPGGRQYEGGRSRYSYIVGGNAETICRCSLRCRGLSWLSMIPWTSLRQILLT